MNKCNKNFNIIHNDLDESSMNNDLNRAYNIVQKEYINEEIFKILALDNDFEKPYAILNIKKLNNQNEADLLIHHLTQQDGRIREAVASKISELVNSCYNYFCNEKTKNKFLDGIMDINPNVARSIIETIKKNKVISTFFQDEIKERITEIIESLKEYCDSPYKNNKLKNTKNHAKNKKVFNLYWLLEALSETTIEYDDKTSKILNMTCDFVDYTIREKTAKILTKMTNPPLKLLQKMQNDENFYVKNLIYDKIIEVETNRNIL